MSDEQKSELRDPYMVPELVLELVLDPPDGITAVWYPHVRAIAVRLEPTS